MAAKCTISEKDYVRAARLSTRLTRKQLTLASAGILSVCHVNLAVSQWFLDSALVALSGFLGGGLDYYTVLICTGLYARWHYRKYKLIQEPFTIQIEKQGIRFESTDYQGTVTWNKILKWRLNNSYLLIYPAPRLYHIIPKTLTEQVFDLNHLIHTPEEKVGKAS